jgi:hypothetical protein
LFDDKHASFFGVSIDPADEANKRVVGRVPGYRLFWDFDGNASRLCGVIPQDADPTNGRVSVRRIWVVLDPTLGYQMERFLVGCYRAEDSGHFAPHRDNTTKGTAHRRFAASVNLNSDFDGGEVSFPEYNPRGFKPPPGGAVVFSCSLLHSVSKVTRGQRYASYLLSTTKRLPGYAKPTTRFWATALRFIRKIETCRHRKASHYR